MRKALDPRPKRVFSAAMLLFVIPLTLVTLGVVTARDLRRARQARVD